MSENEVNYEEDLRIDPDALDTEWLDQSRLFMKYAEEAAKAKREMDKMKENCDVVYAETDSRVRTNPEKYDIEKITESTVKATITKSKRYQSAIEDFNHSKFDYDIAQAAVRAFDMRKSALENLVRLLGQSYFAAPMEPRNLPEQYREKLSKEERGLQKTKPARRALRE